MYDGLTVVYKSSVDLFFYVLGSSKENEILLTSVLNCIYDSISQVKNIVSSHNQLIISDTLILNFKGQQLKGSTVKLFAKIRVSKSL